MIPIKYHTFSPYFKRHTRLSVMLHEPSHDITHPEHIPDRMSGVLLILQTHMPYSMREDLSTRELFDPKRQRQVREHPASDLMLTDINRHSRLTSEMYQRGNCRLTDLRAIIDPHYRAHMTVARGFERHMVQTICNMDEELYQRRHIKPLV